MTEQTCLPIWQMTDNFKFLKLSHSMVDKLIALQFNIYTYIYMYVYIYI